MYDGFISFVINTYFIGNVGLFLTQEEPFCRPPIVLKGRESSAKLKFFCKIGKTFA